MQGMCQLVEVSRAGFYRASAVAAVPPDEVALRDAGTAHSTGMAVLW